jgi:hypothetical protein
MPKSNADWIITSLIPILICGFCIITGSLMAIAGKRTDEFGIGDTPGNNWSYLWIAIAAAVLIATVFLGIHQLRKK